MLKKLLGAFKSLINTGISIASIVFILQDSFGASFTHSITITNSYTPGSIVGKYKYGSIDSGFFYNWLSNTLYRYYRNGANAVRESHVPSAMVDVDGTLYTVDLYGINNLGANFYICKYTSSDDSSIISSSTTHYYP